MKISQAAMENLARYIIRASFSQDRMTYFPEESKVVYRSKDGKEEKIFDALEWLVPPTGGILMCQTRENRWLGIMAITVPPRDTFVPSSFPAGSGITGFARGFPRIRVYLGTRM